MLQKAIAVLIDEPEMRREFGEAGRQRMLDEFSVDQMVESHIDLSTIWSRSESWSFAAPWT